MLEILASVLKSQRGKKRQKRKREEREEKSCAADLKENRIIGRTELETGLEPSVNLSSTL